MLLQSYLPKTREIVLIPVIVAFSVLAIPFTIASFFNENITQFLFYLVATLVLPFASALLNFIGAKLHSLLAKKLSFKSATIEKNLVKALLNDFLKKWLQTTSTLTYALAMIYFIIDLESPIQVFNLLQLTVIGLIAIFLFDSSLFGRSNSDYLYNAYTVEFFALTLMVMTFAFCVFFVELNFDYLLYPFLTLYILSSILLLKRNIQLIKLNNQSFT